MVRKVFLVFCLSVVFLGLVAHLTANQSAQQTIPPEQIALHEAEILIYILPQGQELRNQGMDIGWEVESGPQLNHQDFYTFWVVNPKRSNVQGSVTVGHFSVNKHTADLWDDDKQKAISTTEMEGIKRILRQAHHIDEETVRKFSSLHPNM